MIVSSVTIFAIICTLKRHMTLNSSVLIPVSTFPISIDTQFFNINHMEIVP